MKLLLPWPPSKLSRNGSQGDYRGKAVSARKYRADCLIVARPQAKGWNGAPDGPVMLDMTFCAPDRRRRDLDNLLAMTKQGIDAISEILGIDDSRFEYTLRRGDVVKQGVVAVTI
ncbi:MAG: endodeoxyribonuclease RusA [Pseudomonadota bacterium]